MFSLVLFLTTGILGEPTVATKEKGDRILESVADGWVQVIKEIYTFRQPQAWQQS